MSTSRSDAGDIIVDWLDQTVGVSVSEHVDRADVAVLIDRLEIRDAGEDVGQLRECRDTIARLLTQYGIKDTDALVVVDGVSRLIDQEAGGEG